MPVREINQVAHDFFPLDRGEMYVGKFHPNQAVPKFSAGMKA